jgi:hypothetical protein
MSELFKPINLSGFEPKDIHKWIIRRDSIISEAGISTSISHKDIDDPIVVTINKILGVSCFNKRLRTLSSSRRKDAKAGYRAYNPISKHKDRTR